MSYGLSCILHAELRSMINDALMGTTSAVSVESEPRLSMEPPDLVINASLSRYFCGQGRSNSPFSKWINTRS